MRGQGWTARPEEAGPGGAAGRELCSSIRCEHWWNVVSNESSANTVSGSALREPTGHAGHGAGCRLRAM